MMIGESPELMMTPVNVSTDTIALDLRAVKSLLATFVLCSLCIMSECCCLACFLLAKLFPMLVSLLPFRQYACELRMCGPNKE